VTATTSLRERVLQAVARGWCSPSNAHKGMDATLAEAIADSVVAALSTPAAGEWVLVPREPTDAMRRAFRADRAASTYYTHTTLQCADFDSRYAAMIAAAPEPATQEAG
jgi:hypothetical protein